MWKYTNLENCKTLILGEVNTGKTQLTQKLLEEAETLRKDIAVIDMAPERKHNVGGRLTPSDATDYYTTHIVTPRLSGTTEEEIVELAELNKKRIERLFERYIPKDVLFINDISIYLQRGDVEKIISIISSAKTCIMNGYYGTSLGEDRVSREERRKMIELQKHCNTIFVR